MVGLGGGICGWLVSSQEGVGWVRGLGGGGERLFGGPGGL